MCAPILGVGLSILQAGFGFAAAQQDYAAQSAAWKQNVINSLSAMENEQKQLTIRQIQEEKAKDQKLVVMNIEQAQKQAAAEVSAGEAGVGGISLDNVLADIGRRAAFNRQTEEQNYKMTAAQLTEEMKATTIRAENRINSVQRPSSPNPLGFILQAAGSGIRMLPSAA